MRSPQRRLKQLNRSRLFAGLTTEMPDEHIHERGDLMADSEYVIAQISDIHCGDSRFDPALMESMVEEVNALAPDLVAIAGDLTKRGYPEQFEEAHEWVSRMTCPNKVVVPGNHDSRNVGFIHFDEQFGNRYSSNVFPISGGGKAHVVGVDTSKPDLNQGELGRNRHMWLYNELSGNDTDLKVVVMHHHLIGVPGTGRERNILWDAGDILEILSECQVDLVLCGHKHVPYVWKVNGITLSTSGTASTHRTRGRTPPSFSIVRIRPERIEITLRNTGHPAGRSFETHRRSKDPNGAMQHRRGMRTETE